jgi:hypothetical protein
MASQICKCSHDKRDHQVISASGRGPCCHCLCDSFVSIAPKAKPKVITDETVNAPATQRWTLR